MKKDKYKYKIVFASQIKSINTEEKQQIISFASKSDNLKKLLPKDVNISDNEGFVVFSGEAFISNKLNANFDGVQTAEAIKLAAKYPFTFVDVNHSRKNLCGVIVSAEYTDCANGSKLKENEISASKNPFCVSITGIIWKAPNPELAEAVANMENKNSELKDSVYLSWELGFSDYNLVLIDKNKNPEMLISKGELITDEKQIEKLSDKLISNGGNGFSDDGKIIGRVPINDVIPLGVGLVENPAASVSPIVVENSSKQESKANSNIPKPFKKLIKKLSKEKITKEYFQESLSNLINAYSFSNEGSELFFNKELGICPKCSSLANENSSRYENGSIYCGSCGCATNGSLWKSDKKEKLVDDSVVYKMIANKIVSNTEIFAGIQDCDIKKEIKIESLASEHKTVKCSCGDTISTCRCSHPDKKVEIVKNGCKNCREKEVLANNISQSNNSDVINDNNTKNSYMKLEKIEQLTDENIKEVKSSDIKELFASANKQAIEEGIKNISKEYSDKLTAKENEIKTLSSQAEKTANDIKDLNSKLEEVTKSYNSLVEANKQKEKVESFSARMSSIESKFELNEKQKEIVANKVKAIDSDSDFSNYVKEIEILLPLKKESEKTESFASKDEKSAVSDALKNGEKEKEALPNAGSKEQSLAEKAKAGFGLGAWTVSDKRKNRIS